VSYSKNTHSTKCNFSPIILTKQSLSYCRAPLLCNGHNVQTIMKDPSDSQWTLGTLRALPNCLHPFINVFALLLACTENNGKVSWRMFSIDIVIVINNMFCCVCFFFLSRYNSTYQNFCNNRARFVSLVTYLWDLKSQQTHTFQEEMILTRERKRFALNPTKEINNKERTEKNCFNFGYCLTLKKKKNSKAY
jgi:hypothetical protein